MIHHIYIYTNIPIGIFIIISHWDQSAEAAHAHAAPPLVSSYVLSDIEQPAAVPDPSEDAKVACVYKHGGWTLHL